MDENGTVVRLEYDPNRSANIALIKYTNSNKLQYIISPFDIKPGDIIHASRKESLEIINGNAMMLKYIPIGTKIHCIEVIPGHGAQLCRSAGTFGQILEKERSPRQGYIVVRIASKEVRYINENCIATIGIVSNLLHHTSKIGKAGRKRWMGRRPVVRGLAKNPVDHPHGGGSAAGRCGRPSVSPSGILTKGYKTRRKKNKREHIIIPRGGPPEVRTSNQKSKKKLAKRGGRS